MPIRRLLPLLLLVASVGCSQSRDAAQAYAQYCASCHGPNLEGGSAPTMLDDEWTHGGSDEEIAHLIAKGAVDKGMPAWETVFTEPEIRALVVFMRERRAGYERNRETLPTPAPDRVFATATLERVMAFAAIKLVRTATAQQFVGPFAADQPVLPVKPGKRHQRARGWIVALRQGNNLPRLERQVPAPVADPFRARDLRA